MAFSARKKIMYVLLKAMLMKLHALTPALGFCHWLGWPNLPVAAVSGLGLFYNLMREKRGEN